jgi:hypothetical protein
MALQVAPVPLGEFAMWLAVGGGVVAFWVAMAPVIRAVANRIALKPGTRDWMEQVEARLAALEERTPVTEDAEAQHRRMLDLEERLDFTERMLTRGPGPSGQAPTRIPDS